MEFKYFLMSVLILFKLKNGVCRQSNFITEDLVQKVDASYQSFYDFKIFYQATELARSTLYALMVERLNYQELCLCWLPQTLADMQNSNHCETSSLSSLKSMLMNVMIFKQN